jgi:hypothetical protein
MNQNDQMQELKAMETKREEWFAIGNSVWSEYGCICVGINTKKSADLIAAAPELLDALRGMLQVFGDEFGFGDSETCDKARAAFSKAIGDSNVRGK